MTTAREEVEVLFTTLGKHIITINGAPGTTAEYQATLEALKSALGDHTNIVREIIPLENGEGKPNEKFALSKALAKSQQTDNMIVNFIKTYCDDEGHPGALVNNRMAAISVTDKINMSTKGLKAIVDEYKTRNGRL